MSVLQENTITKEFICKENVSKSQAEALLKTLTIIPYILNSPNQKLSYSQKFTIEVPLNAKPVECRWEIIDVNACDRLNNFDNTGEDYDITTDSLENEVYFKVDLHPFRNRPGHLFVKFLATVRYTYYDEKEEDVSVIVLKKE